MGSQPKAAEVYKVDLADGMPFHYWIVLCAPKPLSGEFLAVSLTDKKNVRAVHDIWPYGLEVCRGLILAKDSVLHVGKTKLAHREWLSENDATLLGACSEKLLVRARCTLFWFGQLLRPNLLRERDWYAEDWKPPCGPTPSAPTAQS